MGVVPKLSLRDMQSMFYGLTDIRGASLSLALSSKTNSAVQLESKLELESVGTGRFGRSRSQSWSQQNFADVSSSELQTLSCPQMIILYVASVA